eukprot:TRINITY_DN111023_c0_g1_i1.p1 TRINITY_DN111023_c0_g1~~TRINITY_DN111023_c0_g1_i1.p1  ORF type:complete len:383 (-),score=71.33 TRINITY_DN111023_c0_g1_i1:111-1259(-)
MAAMSAAQSQSMRGNSGATVGTGGWTGRMTGTAATVAKEAEDDSMEGLMSTLRSVSANSVKAHHQNLLVEIGDTTSDNERTNAMTAKRIGKLPNVDDLTAPRAKPPMKGDPVLKAQLKAEKATFKPFQSMCQTVGHAFGEVKPVRPKVLDTWTTYRMTEPTRNHRYPGSHQLNRELFNSTNPEPKKCAKGVVAFDGNRQLIQGFVGYRFHAQSEPFANCSDDQCSTMHRQWLKEHAEVRDREIYPIYHASERVEKAKAIKAAHEERRQMARDMMSRRQLNPPTFSPNVMKTLGKIKQVVATSHAFHSNAGITVSSVADEQKADKGRLEKALSAPVLQIPQPGPQGRLDHLRPWGGPQRSCSSLRHTTPWRDQDTVRHMRSTT